MRLGKREQWSAGKDKSIKINMRGRFMMDDIRKAGAEDASRLAEILIFAKRTHYRSIFHDDKVSFGKMQVYLLARDYIVNREKLNHIWVYDDEFVKGMLHIEGRELRELYVDPFFQGEGIGTRLIEFAIRQFEVQYLFVLEKNSSAIHFYQSHGFSRTQERRLEEGTAEYVVKMERRRGISADTRRGGEADHGQSHAVSP